MEFELKLAGGKTAVWEGKDAAEAIRRYQDAHRDAVVLGWRSYPRHGVFQYAQGSIVEPGDPRW